MNLIFLLVCAGCSVPLAEQLSFSVDVEKSDYISGEDVLVRVVTRNLTDQELTVRYPFLGAGLQFIIQDERGEQYTYKSITSGGRGKWTVKPNEEYTGIYSLRSWYGKKQTYFDLRGYFPPGRFQVYAIYSLEYDDTVSRIISDSISLIINETPTNEIKALKLLQLAHERERFTRGDSLTQIIQALTTIVTDYPASVFRPEAMSALRRNYEFHGDSTIAWMWVKRLAEEYPNTLLAESEVSGSNWKMHSNQREAFLLDLSTRFPDQRVGKSARHILVGIKQK